MRRNRFETLGRWGRVLFLSAIVSGISLAHAEPEDADVYWKQPAQGSDGERAIDPVLMQRLFSMPPDVMEEVETPVRPPRSPKSWLGITMQESPPLFLKDADDFSPTIQVLEVFPDSSAHRAGL